MTSTKLFRVPFHLPEFGHLQDGPFIQDGMEYVLRVASDENTATALRSARTFKVLRDPDDPEEVLGRSEGFAIVRLSGWGAKAVRAFAQEIERIPQVVAAIPAFRDASGRSRMVVPGELVARFRANEVSNATAAELGRRGATVVGPSAGGVFRLRLAPDTPLTPVFALEKDRPDIDFIDVVEIGELLPASGAFPPQPSVPAAAAETTPLIPRFIFRKEYQMLLLGDTEDEVSLNEFRQRLQQMASDEDLTILSRTDSLSEDKTVFVRVEDEAESATVVERIRAVPAVEDVFPGLQDSVDGVIRFADLRFVVVGLRDDPAAADWDVFGASHGLTLLQLDASLAFAVFEIGLNSDLQGILESLRNDERVRFAEPAYVSDDEDDVTGENVIHDPPDSGLWNHQAINLQTAWNTTKGAGVVVAVVDTLAKLDHPGLQEALFVIDDHLNFSGRNRIKDHGTHVMGIIGGRLSAPDVTLGVAPAARILAIAINTTMGSYPNRATALCFLADVANAKRLRIPESGIDLPVERLVVNCSWATTGDVFVIRDAIRRLVAAGALVCCSAGNDGRDAEGRHFPSDYDGVVCVAATDRVNRKLNVSNFGAKISFCAPGGDGDPLDEGDIFSLLAETSAGYLYGTSMASPHAAAVAALAWSLLPHRSATEIVEILRTTAKSIDSDQAIPTLQGQLGSGLIDAGAAVVRALEINPP